MNNMSIHICINELFMIQNKLLRDNINEMQMKFKDNEFNFEKTRLALEHKVQELELIIKQLKGSQKTSEDDKK